MISKKIIYTHRIFETVEEKEKFSVEWKNTCEIVKRGLEKCKNQKLKD